ncbi:cytidylate kinase-like family protein [Eubacterium sp.]|uniref:cytidylate kinase-like family protein n=1 Tax=Eubacterium sp. TaxID=142586 RepID=UPI002FCBC2CB
MAKIITIGRQFGSNGRAIAKNLADHLGIAFYDKQLIGLAAEKSELPVESLVEVDEKKTNPLLYASVDYKIGAGYSTTAPINDVLFQAQSEVIRGLARKEDCVIVGRCADFVLRSHPEARHVYIYAPMDKRIQTVCERDGVGSKEAQSIIKKIDKQRRLYYSYYTDLKWGSFENYHLALDSGRMSMDNAVDLLSLLYGQI